MLSCGLGASWVRDGGIPQGCLLSMVFTVALSCFGVITCKILKGFNRNCMLKCVARDPQQLLGLPLGVIGWVVSSLHSVRAVFSALVGF